MKLRLKRVAISPEMIAHIMEDDTAWRVESGIPKGSKVRSFTIDPYTAALHLFLEHSTFPLVSIEEVVPQLKTAFKKIL